MKHTLLFITLCALTPALHAADLPVVENGQPRAQIVIPAENRPRMTTLAALELRLFIEKMSGARLPIVTAPTAEGGVKLHVGESAATRQLGITGEGLQHGAYRVVTGADWAVLLGADRDFSPGKMPWPMSRNDVPRAEAEWKKITAGKSDAEWAFPFSSGFKAWWSPKDFTQQMTTRYGEDFPKLWSGEPGFWNHDQAGSIHAVHDLLRQFGARFFMPGEIGEVVPNTPSLAIAAQNQTVKPDFAMRDWLWYHYGGFEYDDVIWARRIGMNSCADVLGPLKGPHGLVPVLGTAAMKQKHPEYYALIGGKRDTEHRDRGTPCFSSEGLVTETVRYIRFLYDTFDVPSVDIWPVDGLRGCQCEKCVDKSPSDLVWGFADRVARRLYESHPAKRVTCGAYTSYKEPPSGKETLSPNLCVWIANAGRPLLTDPERWADYNSLIAAWRSRIAPGNLLRLENNRYHIFGDKAPISHPVLHPRAVARDLKMLKGISLGDTGEQSQVNGTWRSPALEHITLYVQSRFLWDAGQDVDALLKDYCTRFYGPAAQAMDDAIAFAENNLAFKDQSRSRGRASPANVTLAVGLAFRDRLDKARQIAGDTIHGRRVQAIIDSLQPREEYITQKREKEASLAAARAKAPVAKPGIEYSLKDNLAANKATTVPTTFRAAWEQGSLVFDIVCHEPHMAKLNIASDVYNGDCVTISIETPLHSYYHVEINPDGRIHEGNPSGDWKSNAEVKTTRTADSWSVRVRLPVVGEAEAASDPKHRIAGAKPTAERPWFFNIGRQRSIDLPKAELQAFSPTQSGWHQPEKFGKFVVE